MKKKMLVCLLVLSMAMSLLPLTAFAAEDSGECGEGLSWKLDKGVLTISGEGAMEDYEYGMAPWYSWAADITSVKVEKGVTHIGDTAFHGCELMVSASLPEGLESIGFAAFYHCVSLKEISIPDSVRNIGRAAFSDCSELASVSLPKDLEEIGESAFHACASLKSIEIPGKIKTIETGVFNLCISLESISLPAGVREIKGRAFEMCEKLSTVIFSGTEAQWNTMRIAPYNDPLTAAKPQTNKPIYTDVAQTDYYYEAVRWALDKGILGGTEKLFGPNEKCTRREAAILLWKAAGEPEPESEAELKPFADVPETADCYKAVLWAQRAGVISGVTEDRFDPEGTCSRAMIVTLLWRVMGRPDSAGNTDFTDVEAGEYYAVPVAWAVKEGIVKGVSASTFGPLGGCTRAMLITALYRTFNT